jgi:molybdopterin molybdotransferase
MPGMDAIGPSPLAAGEDNLSVDAARSAIAAALAPPDLGSENVPLAAAAGRVLAAPLVSPLNVPAHDNSAMDGFAFDGAALAAGHAPLELAVTGSLMAGARYAGRIGAGQCLRIMTGAPMPEGCDTVVPFELAAQLEGGTRIRVAQGAVRRGENLRRRGEDLALGAEALAAGRRLRPADVGLAASLGLTELPVRRRLKVALFSTGDEVVAPGRPLPPGAIYDSNRFALAATVQRLGMEVVDLGLVRDDPDELQAALRQAVQRADVVLTSGGVSAGDADYTRDVLARLGNVAFWKVAMRPGRPFAFGPLRRAGGGASWLFGLPGNPVAALVTFHVFVRDALLALAGARPEPLPALPLPCAVPIRKRPGRSEFQRGIVEPDAAGRWCVKPFAQQGAGILRSMSEANALIVLGHERGSVAAGENVDVWPFDGLV